MEYAGRRLLVTGGAGFIGSHLVDVIARTGPAAIHVVDNLFLGRRANLREARRNFPGLRFHRMDATSGRAMRALIRRERIEIAFNLATKALPYSFDEPTDAFHVNVQIVGHLLEALRGGEIARLIHFSSSEAYGSAQHVPMAESHPLLPTTPYAAGKAAADVMVRSYQETFGVRVLTVRPFNNYGPRQNQGLYAGVIPVTMTRILRGETPVIHGTGQQTRDFTFVRDTAEIVAALGARDDVLGRVVNLGSGAEVTIADLIERICAIAGYDGPVQKTSPRPGDVERQCADVGVLRSIAGTSSLRSLDEGLAETWAWYRRAAARPGRRR